jgi:DNA-directed RNA polymerase specialized sigma24 family protein
VTSSPSRAGTVDVTASADAAAVEFEAELSPLLEDALRLATAMLFNAVEAEDAVQEACLHAWRRRANRHDGTDLRPWFLAIVANCCRAARVAAGGDCSGSPMSRPGRRSQRTTRPRPSI